MNNIAAAAITLKKALEPTFRDYAEILQNAQVLARTLLQHSALPPWSLRSATQPCSFGCFAGERACSLVESR
jgi:hypothetical protein